MPVKKILKTLTEADIESGSLPPGDFRFRKAVDLSGKSLTGAGMHLTRIWVSRPESPAFDLTSHPGKILSPGIAVTPDYCAGREFGSSISNLSIMSAVGGIGIRISGNSQDVRISNVSFHSLATAIKIDSNRTIQNCRFRDCCFYKNETNISIRQARTQYETYGFRNLSFVDCNAIGTRKTHLKVLNESLMSRIDGIFWDRGLLEMSGQSLVCELSSIESACPIQNVLFDSVLLRGPRNFATRGSAFCPMFIRDRG